jgi:hypothetical protein
VVSPVFTLAQKSFPFPAPHWTEFPAGMQGAMQSVRISSGMDRLIWKPGWVSIFLWASNHSFFVYIISIKCTSFQLPQFLNSAIQNLKIHLKTSSCPRQIPPGKLLDIPPFKTQFQPHITQDKGGTS